MRIGKAFFENGAEAKPADAEVKTEEFKDNGNADAGAAEEAPKKGKVGRPAKK